MKAIMVMFDSLNRHMLPPYGCQWTHMPNFQRLADRAVTFDHSCVGSMPCMPARRELHTGRYNFLHRSWGPLEPFDDSAPEILKRNGVYSHLCSDHYHYWEDGGCTYHQRYSTWEISRGQEGDFWKAQVADPKIPDSVAPRDNTSWRQDWINRRFMQDERDQPQARTFTMGMEFLERNHAEDNWFLHIETFDPHEPYFSSQQYKDLYPHDYHGPHFDWPPYGRVRETREQVEHCRYENAALHSMCDHYLGTVLDFMDAHDMWRDTMLIVNTDHGFLLGEHDSWAKCWMPFYEEIAHTPLFIWDPRCGCAGERRTSLVQTIDLPATLLEYFGVERPRDMQGRPLRDTVAHDTPVRAAGLFGIHGGQVNVTDGRYVYMRAPVSPANTPLYNYTVMPTHMNRMFSVEELRTATLAAPFTFTKGCPTMRIESGFSCKDTRLFDTMLFDVVADPQQQSPLEDKQIEQRMLGHLMQLMQDNDAPSEQFERLGLTLLPH
jgi:arylsulfatase A-like enzyme